MVGPTGGVNSAQILVPSRAYTYIAPVGTIAPVDESAALDPAWNAVGLTTPDSLSFATNPTFDQVVSHQSDYPVRRMQTGEEATVSVDLQQWNTANLTAVFGGGTVTAPTAGKFKFVPPALGARPEKSAIIEAVDGTKRYRWVFPRVMQVEGVESALNKGNEARLPLRLAVLGDDTASPWYLLTNDPAFVVTP